MSIEKRARTMASIPPSRTRWRGRRGRNCRLRDRSHEQVVHGTVRLRAAQPKAAPLCQMARRARSARSSACTPAEARAEGLNPRGSFSGLCRELIRQGSVDQTFAVAPTLRRGLQDALGQKAARNPLAILGSYARPSVFERLAQERHGAQVKVGPVGLHADAGATVV